jgi:NitT/TauT family transport system substrate-binding protein
MGRKAIMGCRDRLLAVVALLVALAAPDAVRAEDTLKLAVGQKGFWDTSVPEFGQRMGFFEAEGLKLDILYTQGGAETERAVFAGSVDLGIANGLLGVLGGAAKGVPVKVISAEFTGVSDLFWYARSESGIAGLKDAAGKTMGFSSPGSSTNLVLDLLVRQAGVPIKPVPVGAAPASLTQVMSGQIDIGWSAAPFAFDEIDAGKIRIVARGTDVKELAGETVRVQIAPTSVVEHKRDQLVRFQRASQKTIDWMYKDDKAIAWFAEGAHVTADQARRAVAEFYPKPAMRLGAVAGLDLAIQQAIDAKRLTAPLTREQIDTLMAIVYEPPKE